MEWLKSAWEKVTAVHAWAVGKVGAHPTISVWVFLALLVSALAI